MHDHHDRFVIIGIDTHADTHHLAVITDVGQPLHDITIPATPAGYRQALDLVAGYHQVDRIGIECTGSYGAEITRHFLATGYRVIEVNRPNAFDRRRQGKTDTFDAYSAAEAVLSGRAIALPKGNDGLVQSLRVLCTTRTSAVHDRTATINQIKAMLVAAPDDLRTKYRGADPHEVDQHAGSHSPHHHTRHSGGVHGRGPAPTSSSTTRSTSSPATSPVCSTSMPRN